MIDELVLERLFAETAEEIPTPEKGMTRVIDEIELSAHETRRVSVTRPARTIAAVAAVIVVVVGIGAALSSNSSHSNVSVESPSASKSLTAGGSADAIGAPSSFGAGSSAARTRPPVAGAQSSVGITSGGSSSGSTTTAEPVDGAKIVKTGTLDIQVARHTLPTAVNRVTGVAVGLDGYVANSTTNYDVTDPTAQITLRVPVDNFEAAIKQLKGMPDVKVLGDSETGKDVTAQYTDLQAQLTAAQTEATALDTVLANAQTIPDILAVRDRITNVQSEINQLQGQINLLGDKADFSAVAVTLAEKPVTAAPAHVSAPPTGLSKAWRDARDGFSNSLEWMLARSGGALIVLLAALALVFGLRYFYPVVRRALL